MDPLALLKATIDRKRQAAQPSSSKKRWRSAVEMEHERQENYKRQERHEQKLRDERKKQKLEHQTEEEKLFDTFTRSSTTRKRQLLPSAGAENEPTALSEKIRETKDPPLCKEEVVKRLRFLKQPITLFGEDVWDRFDRLRELELEREEVTEGQKNVYQTKMRAMEAKDAEDDIYAYNNAKLPHLEQKTENEPQVDPGTHNQLITCKEDYVHYQIQKYMKLWLSEIESMSMSERRTWDGRQSIAKFEMTKDWLKPLHKLLRKRKLKREIIDALKDIFQATAKRDYVKANTLYLERLAIGNAPWPMGATMVGIHARAAREKIGEDKIAHVMNDEKTRKYIQSVKRLITVAERNFPRTE